MTARPGCDELNNRHVLIPVFIPSSRRFVWAVVSRAATTLAALAVAALTVFHVYLFGAAVVHGAIADPAVALRWGAAGGVVTALVALRRCGASLVGRRAVAMWVLAALLHGPALAGPSSAGRASLPDVLATLIETTIAGACALGLMLGAFRRTPARRTSFNLPPERPAAAAVVSRVSLTPWCPRPPPLPHLAFRS